MTWPEEYQLPEHPLPILVQLGLTYRCNLKCKHCYALYRRSRGEFSLAEIEDLADQLYGAGSASLVYSHGENMIRTDFHDAATIFRDRDFYQTLMLNGFYVETVADARRLVDAGINRAMVSIDSIDPAVHNHIRGKSGAFDVAVRALRLLKEGGMPTVGFSTTIDTHNYRDVEQIAAFALDLGVDAVSFMQNRYNLTGVFDRSLWPTYLQTCQTIYQLLLDYQGTLDVYTHDPFMLTVLDDRLTDRTARETFIGSNLCNVGTSMVSIDPVGNVSGCNFIEESIGNVREEPFQQIWDRLVARYSDTADPPSGPCGSCSALGSCMGGCKAFHYNGKYDERCGAQRFIDPAPHDLATAQAPIPDTTPTRAPGVFVGLPRVRVSGASR
ncbi:radical SAM/SPASM domain-containing protein [Nocardia seriolae]|uniref:radical SAM/SPASM domain-containing protein n=1 Tax=Nocardia seriolae TaxID=37332 RepID=UPI00137889F1|nr:radical SAM protein [Nocardia seriolae]QOW30717.1 radical SAM protein [Nocardia seriolae]WNJ57650.1 radical SAM protein [Nocardia seriolae]